jgi:hypothetical protein
MRRIIILFLLVAIAAAAGVVRSYSKAGHSISEMRALTGDSGAQGEAREEIRKSYELLSGAQVEVSGINGALKIETSDTRVAEVYVERIGKSAEALQRRKITIESSPSSLTIRGEKGDVGFLARFFGSSPGEQVTLKLPRQISLVASGINGAVITGQIDGSVTVQGVNGKVDVAQAGDSAEFHGINGNIAVSLNSLDKKGISINGVNGNIDLRLREGAGANLEAHGMNGNVVSDLPDFVLEKAKHGSYFAHIGTGGNSISAHGINGNIRLSRATTASTKTLSEQAKGKG